MKNSILHSEKRPLTKGFLSCLLVFLLLALPFWIAATLLPFSFASWLSWLLSGWLTWTFTEYSVHRFYMHRAQPNLQQKLYQSHMNHHRNPSRIKITLWQRLGMFLCGIILLYFSYALHPLIVIFTGFFLGFIGYTLMHWVLHQSWAERFFPRLQKSHIHHHGKFPDKCFGFSLILWDLLFGTLPPEKIAVSLRFRNFYFKNSLPEQKNIPEVKKG